MTKRNIMTENLREEIAKELGVYDQVKQDGGSWENVSSKTCGSIVSKASKERRRLGKHTFKNLRKHGNKSNRNSKQKYKIAK